MTEELCHKALAEAHDLHIGLALGVEVGAALTAADRKTGQGVLEDLLKAEEFDDTDIYGRMQTDTALIRADRGVELNAVAGVNLYLTVVVDPRNTEFDLALGLTETLEQRLLLVKLFFFSFTLASTSSTYDIVFPPNLHKKIKAPRTMCPRRLCLNSTNYTPKSFVCQAIDRILTKLTN